VAEVRTNAPRTWVRQTIPGLVHIRFHHTFQRCIGDGTAVDSTIQVLLGLADASTLLTSSSAAELLDSPFGATVSEMNTLTKHVVLRVAGRLILWLAVAAFAQETASSPTPAPGTSAPPTGQFGSTESSQSQVPSGTRSLTGETVPQTGKAGGKGDPAFGGERHPLYRITRSDTMDINFTFSPDFNQTLTVQPDGFVTLKGASLLLAEGLTVPQMQQAVALAYRGFLREPEVTVTLKEFDKPYFLASGEVTRPGKYELRGDLTVSEAIAIAGGLTQQARHSQVVVFRRISPYVAESHVVDLKHMLDSRDLNEDLHLQPGDFIFVPQSRISKIRKYVPTNSMSWYMNPMQF
jgi:polysaccharide export outer membrane protein